MSSTPPPLVRRRSLAKRLFYVLLWGAVLCVVGIVFLYLRENFLGARAWRAAEAEAHAAGESLDKSTRVPPPAESSANFFALPIWEAMAGRKREELDQGLSDWSGKRRLERLKLSTDGPSSEGAWRYSEFFDFTAWQKRAQPDTLEEPPAKVALAALAPFEADLAELQEGAGRPRARFPAPYAEPVFVFPHHEALRNFSRALQLRALSRLALGDTEAAARDVLLGIRLGEALREEPLLIPQLVRGLNVVHSLQPLWEGLARRQWSDAQLGALEAALQSIDLVAVWPSACRGERDLFSMPVLDAMRMDRAKILRINSEGSWTDPYLAILLPVGWVDFNRAWIVHGFGEYIHAAIPARHLFDVQKVKSAAERLEPELVQRSPRRFMAAIMFPSIPASLERLAWYQVMIDEARVAIALERYRLQYDAWPELLTLLPPMPIDAVSGEPLHYRRSNDGSSFVLYSVGWNGADDQGTIARKPALPRPRENAKEGDWVWPRYPVIPAP